MGLSQQLNELEVAINEAAERATPGAHPVLVEAIQDLRFKDIQPILGSTGGATRHLQARQGDRVTQALLPETRRTLEETGGFSEPGHAMASGCVDP